MAPRVSFRLFTLQQVSMLTLFYFTTIDKYARIKKKIPLSTLKLYVIMNVNRNLA